MNKLATIYLIKNKKIKLMIKILRRNIQTNVAAMQK